MSKSQENGVSHLYKRGLTFKQGILNFHQGIIIFSVSNITMQTL